MKNKREIKGQAGQHVQYRPRSYSPQWYSERDPNLPSIRKGGSQSYGRPGYVDHCYLSYGLMGKGFAISITFSAPEWWKPSIILVLLAYVPRN